MKEFEAVFSTNSQYLAKLDIRRESRARADWGCPESFCEKAAFAPGRVSA